MSVLKFKENLFWKILDCPKNTTIQWYALGRTSSYMIFSWYSLLVWGATESIVN